MSDPNYNAALTDIERAAARVAPHLQSHGGQVQAAGFLPGFAGILMGLFLKALSEQLMEEAQKAGVDVVKWVVAKIRAYFKEDPKPAEGQMRIMPHIPSGGDPVRAEQMLQRALAEFLPASEAAALAGSVRRAIESRLL